MSYDAMTHESDAVERARPGTAKAIKRGLVLLGVVVVWLALAGYGGPLISRLAEVQENDNANFLPETAESTLVSDLSGQFSGDQPLPYFLVFEREGGITPDDLAAISTLVEALPELELDVDESAVVDESLVEDTYPLSDYLVPGPPALVQSEDGEAVLVPVLLDTEASTQNLPDGQTVVFQVAETLRAAIADTVGQRRDRRLRHWPGRHLR